jgi:hypothetical protein
MLYCEVVTFWSDEVVNKHHTEGSGKATPPVCRYKYVFTHIEKKRNSHPYHRNRDYENVYIQRHIKQKHRNNDVFF